jgi:hypothetical protein
MAAKILAMCGLFVVLASIDTSVAVSRTHVGAAVAPEACALLTTADASKALGVTSRAGERMIASSPKECIWSDDPEHGMNSRRVTLTILPPVAFQMGKADPKIKIEPASGIGDEAYYEVFRADSPFLVVRKGGAVFTVRVLNGGGKLKAFTLEEEKAKEAELAKAAVSRL